MKDWLKQLCFDPIPAFLSSGNEALVYFVKRDLLEENVDSLENLWQLPFVERYVRNQQEDGSWRYPGGKLHVRSQQSYNQLETFRIVGQLVELYGLTKKHPAIAKAAEFLYRFQNEEGDFRGIYGNQYTPNYTAAIMELLIKAGYGEDPRIERSFDWLLSIRQNDGGWTIPFRTVGKGLKCTNNPETIKPDKSKPFSHCITGVVLRAFAAHPKFRKTTEAKMAGDLLKSRFFQPDRYPDRQAADFWTRFTFPFWFTDLVSSLDSLSFLSYTKDDEQIQKALKWLRNQQVEDGVWKLTLTKGTSIKDLSLWMSFAVCRVFKRL